MVRRLRYFVLADSKEMFGYKHDYIFYENVCSLIMILTKKELKNYQEYIKNSNIINDLEKKDILEQIEFLNM